MATNEILTKNFESNDPSRVHWRSIAAGGLVAGLTYLILTSLGFAIGASGLQAVAESGEGGQALGLSAAAWVLGTVLISLFVGSYTSSRANRQTTMRVGAIQGAVIVSLFFLVALTQVGAMLGSLGKGLGDITGNVIGKVASIADNPRVTSLVEDQIGDLKFRQPFAQVSSGVVARLMRGDKDSAKNYLAAQTGISRDNAQERLDALSAKLEATLQQLGERAAEAAKTGGWIAFGTLVLASIASILGGATGAQVSLRRSGEALSHRRAAHARSGHHRTAHA